MRKERIAFITEGDYTHAVCVKVPPPPPHASVRRNYVARNQVTLIPAACVRNGK